MIATVYIGKPPRFGGHAACGKIDPVQISEEFRKCVVFICAGEARDRERVGTGCVVSRGLRLATLGRLRTGCGSRTDPAATLCRPSSSIPGARRVNLTSLARTD
jgi:hypothetical protein